MNQTRFMMNNRFPPLRGTPSYMSRIYRSDLRPIIICVAFIAFLWSLVAGISSYRNVPYFNSNNESKLGVFYIILGSIYMVIAMIEAFGVFAAATRRVAAVRSFAYLSILVTLLALVGYIIQTVVHYTFKNDIINLCTNINTGDRIFFTGFFGPIDGGALTPLEALEWCDQQFNRDSFSNIVALLATTAVSVIFLLFVFAYHRQLCGFNDVANVSRGQFPRDDFYDPPYTHAQNDAPPPQYSNPGDKYGPDRPDKYEF